MGVLFNWKPYRQPRLIVPPLLVFWPTTEFISAVIYCWDYTNSTLRMLVKRPTWAYCSIENHIVSRGWWYVAVVGLIDQQPNLSVLLSIAEITLIQRFACWSKDQHGLMLQLKIISSAAVVAHAVVGLLTNNRSYQCFYPLLKLS